VDGLARVGGDQRQRGSAGGGLVADGVLWCLRPARVGRGRLVIVRAFCGQLVEGGFDGGGGGAGEAYEGGAAGCGSTVVSGGGDEVADLGLEVCWWCGGGVAAGGSGGWWCGVRAVGVFAGVVGGGHESPCWCVVAWAGALA
jgi:hypothetical protein